MTHFIDDFWLKNAHLYENALVCRFPPEPNGYLHLGHAKAAVVGFDMVEKHGGTFILRFDDTNPRAEKTYFEEAIKDDLAWLGVAFHKTVHASDHFENLRDFARDLLKKDLAYVDETNKDTLAKNRGSFYEPGKESADRFLPSSTHVNRFEKMLAGGYREGEAVLRAKIDMASPNMNLRDPVLWRVMGEKHPRLPGWEAFPTYDFAHPFCDLLDGVTLSLCSLEFEDHKPLYNWIAKNAIELKYGNTTIAPTELEFARLTPDRGMTSKRVLKKAVEEGLVTGWSDPRLLTLRGLRRKGYTPDHIKNFVRRAGVSRANSVVPLDWLDEEVRGATCPAHLIVMDPVRLILDESPNILTLPDKTTKVFSGNEWLVSRDDIRDEASVDFFRLAPKNTVRVMGLSGFATVHTVKKDKDGRIVSVHAAFSETGKAKKTVHAVPLSLAESVEIKSAFVWDGASDPRLSLVTEKGVLIKDDCKEMTLIHAVRLGWGVLENGVFSLTARIKGGALAPVPIKSSVSSLK